MRPVYELINSKNDLQFPYLHPIAIGFTIYVLDFLGYCKQAAIDKSTEGSRSQDSSVLFPLSRGSWFPLIKLNFFLQIDRELFVNKEFPYLKFSFYFNKSL